MKSIRKIGTVGALVLLLGLWAAPPVSAQAEQASIEDVQKLIKVLKMDTLMTAMLPAIKKQVLDLMWARVPGAKQVDKDAVTRLFNETMDKMPSEFLKLAVPLYRQHFTKGEVSAMLKFYTSPEGRSIVGKLPAVTQEGQKLGALLGQKLAKEGIDRSRKELRARGYEL